MSKPMLHAISSSKRFGGLPEDYLPIHDFMDSSKSVIADNRHRVLTHNSWFIGVDGPLERVFGKELLIPREGQETTFEIFQADIAACERHIAEVKQKQRRIAKTISIRDIGEQHVLEDFQGRFIPTPADYMFNTPFEAWMDNGRKGSPPSQLIHRQTPKFDRD